MSRPLPRFTEQAATDELRAWLESGNDDWMPADLPLRAIIELDERIKKLERKDEA